MMWRVRNLHILLATSWDATAVEKRGLKVHWIRGRAISASPTRCPPTLNVTAPSPFKPSLDPPAPAPSALEARLLARVSMITTM